MGKSSYDVNPSLNFNSRFKQQKLKAWQPILTAGTVLPTFFIIGVAFLPIGTLLLITSNNVQERIYDYTDKCMWREDPDISCKDVIKNASLAAKLANSGGVCHCDIDIVLDVTIESPVYIYYGLTNFYQNHRRYVKSRSDVQLLGDWKSTPGECSPFDKNDSLYIVPCGAVANSWFNDTFVLKVKDNSSNPAEVPLLYTGIAWPSDRSKKFFNPTGGWTDAIRGQITKPPYWQKPVYNLSKDEDENGFKNESFIVWMRTAALPTFRKLHSRVNHTGKLVNGLTAGTYTVSIGYNYPVDSFGGTKRFIISNTSWAGGKNPFLGIAYIVVGSLCILTGLVFLLIHMKFGKALSDLAAVN